ncbi:hypothetical protein KZO83_07605 [Chromohalobacter sp. TMW 2.2308]|uniref:hypothetical protein n=1 Tax=Chromohalobacter TaxID=42054 RepID=UPI001FFD2EE9|nr:MULTISPECIES: hypothetical protein [Chromohalobacter]MCK2042552.1 hypothetical protein [Chromohalobacter moromii]MCT8514928.1 hypothetical protein [Chromohalobacter sp. TMW 2.2271]
MTNYIVSFEISSDRDNYAEVRKSLMDAAQKIANELPWEETTSFLSFKSSYDLQGASHVLYFDSKLLESKDKLLVIDLTNKKYIQRGMQYPVTLKDSLGLSEVKVI